MKEKQLAEQIIELKAEERALRDRRTELERELAEALTMPALGKSQSYTLEQYRVQVARKVNRRIDPTIWEAVRNKIPEHLRPVRTRYDVDTKGYKWLESNRSDLFRLFSQAVIETEAKLAVNVEVK